MTLTTGEAAPDGPLDAAYRLARPALFRLDAERAHEVVLGLLRLAPAAAVPLLRRLVGVPEDPRLAVEAFGLRFPNPIGLAAGMDKNAVALPAWAGLGFGHVEVGTLTPRAQPGQPRPRVFRIPSDEALVNRMGFPNQGAAAAAARLRRARGRLPLVVGGNVGKAAVTPLAAAAEDYRCAAALIAPAVDYLAINVSSPNTPGLRSLQAPDHVAAIVRSARAAAPKPVVLKLAPDLDFGALVEVVAAAREGGVAGFIATNTTLSREGLSRAVAADAGGVSGRPLRALALRFTERLALAAGPSLPIIAAGGIASPADARERLAAGARLVQVYTGLVYEGPGLVARLLRELDADG